MAAYSDGVNGSRQAHSGGWVEGAPGLALMLFLAVAAGIFFQEGIFALLEAWTLPEYSHGPLIPFLSAFLFLRDFKSLPPVYGPVEGRWPGVLVVAASLVLGALGKAANIGDIVAYAMILFVAGLMLTTLGWRRGIRCWPAIVHLVFMLPLPGILYWKVSTTLQLISSELGVALIRMASIPVFLDGNIIDLGVYKLHVAEACSGLRYLYPIMSFSYIFAALYRGPIWHKAVLLLMAAPITVVMNSVRIGLIGVIVDSYGLTHVEGIAHLLEGWVIFLISVLILFAAARLMLALQRTPMTLTEALDLDFEGLGQQAARIRLTRASTAMAAIAAVTTLAAAGWSALPERGGASFDRAPLATFPVSLDGWRRVSTQSLDRAIEQALGADDYFSGVYVHNDAAATVDVFIAWYRDQSKGGIHSPEVCLPGGGWEMAEINRIELPGPPEVGVVPLNRAIIQRGLDRLLVYYWFEQYGGRTASDYTAKAMLLRDAIRHGRTDGALMRIITQIRPGESDAAAEARLREVFDPLLGRMSEFVPTARAAP